MKLNIEQENQLIKSTNEYIHRLVQKSMDFAATDYHQYTSMYARASGAYTLALQICTDFGIDANAMINPAMIDREKSINQDKEVSNEHD